MRVAARFTWNPLEYATGYGLYLDGYAGASPLMVSPDSPSVEVELDLTPGNHQFSIEPMYAGGAGPMSTVTRRVGVDELQGLDVALILIGGGVGAPPSSEDYLLVSGAADATHQNVAFADQTALFRLTFDVDITGAVDLVVGTGQGTISGYGDYDATLRASSEDFLWDARGSSSYTAENSVSVSNGTVLCEMYVDPSTGFHSSTVNGVVIASGYGFRNGAVSPQNTFAFVNPIGGTEAVIRNLQLTSNVFSGYVSAVVEKVVTSGGSLGYGPSDSPAGVFYGRTDLENGDTWGVTATSGISVTPLEGGDFTWNGTGTFDWEIRRAGLLVDSGTYIIS